MPPRWITATIIGLWLTTTSWMLYREISFRYRAGEPPPFTIDLTDEVGADTISWTVIFDGKRVGLGKSSVNRRGGSHPAAEEKFWAKWVQFMREKPRSRNERSFYLYSDFRFEEGAKELQGAKELFGFRKVTSINHVTPSGELLEMMAEVDLDWPQKFFGGKNVKARIACRVENQELTPRVELDTWDEPPPNVTPLLDAKPETMRLPLDVKIKVPKNVLNPMLLVNKINGLGEGQKWLVPLLDPTSFQGLSIPFMEAVVSAAEFRWQGELVPCFRIDYHDRAGTATARTWVRQRDGLVLQQEAEQGGKTLIVQRDK